MKAMEIFRRYRAADEDTERLRRKIDQWREIMDSIGAPQPDPNGGGHGSADPDRTGRALAEIDALEREIARRERERGAEQAAVLSLLDMIPDLESRVLYQYYIRGIDTTMIAKKKKYTAGYVRKVKRSGEQMLDMIPEEKVGGTLPAWYIEKEKEAKT